MHHSGISGWRWTRTTWLVVACAVGFVLPTVYGQKDMGAGYCSKHGNYTGSSCPSCNTGGGYEPPNKVRGPTAHQIWQEKENARLERAARAGKLNTLAREAWDRRDYTEALRLFQEQQTVIDGPKVRENIAMARAAINQTESRNAANRLRMEANTTYDRGDHSGALALYRRALAVDPNCLTDDGKKWVQNLEARLNSASAIQQAMDKYPAALSAAPSSGGLDFIATDPMVVDARNVPSGLPQSVEAAIPRTPAGKRIRKGFQAIADHDWKAALLWFQDAYNREPGDPGLQRLVDLAQFTLDAQAKARQPAAESYPTNAPTTPAPSLSPDSTAARDIVANPQETPVTRNNFMARLVARNMAAEARVKEVYEELRKKHGGDIPFNVRYSLETNAKLQQARDGGGLSPEELNAQFEDALTEYLKTHKTYQSSVGGSAAAEEIILGGKG